MRSKATMMDRQIITAISSSRVGLTITHKADHTPDHLYFGSRPQQGAPPCFDSVKLRPGRPRVPFWLCQAIDVQPDLGEQRQMCCNEERGYAEETSGREDVCPVDEQQAR
jgi:hypothetical protein